MNEKLRLTECVENPIFQFSTFNLIHIQRRINRWRTAYVRQLTDVFSR